MNNAKVLILLFSFTVLVFIKTVALDMITISGHITDAVTGEDLVGLTVAEENTFNGSVSNVYGFYSFTLPQGVHTISYSFVGYQKQILKVHFDKNKIVNIKMQPVSQELNEVSITGERRDANITSVQMGVERLDMKQVEKMPVLLGEKDILKTIQLLPGISSTSEGSAGFSVRGGSIDQNLILLDEASVYSASHLMGFFSVFNSDALKNTSVYKGGIPANYGGRTSSVVDVQMKEGNNQYFSVSGGIGLIFSRLTIEGPIIKDKMSFMLSGRRSYLDLVARTAGYIESNTSLYFYDLNAKVNYKVNDKNRFFLSGYFGSDDFGYEGMGVSWGNKMGTFRWNHIITNKLFSNTTLVASHYKYGFQLDDDAYMKSGIVDYGIKQDFTHYINTGNTLKFGLNATLHNFNPGELHMEDYGYTEICMDENRGLETGMYISNNQKISNRISAEYGVRFPMFNQIGEGWLNTYNEDNEIVDSVYYGKGEIMKTYWDIEPRVSLNYSINKVSSVKMSFNRMAQYLMLLSNSTSGQPQDTWIPVSNNIKPQKVMQYAIGYFRNFDDNNYEFSVESYYKDLKNVVDYEDGADVFLNEDVEAGILSGIGRSYGMELYFKKKYGKFNGWISYTLARTEQKIDGINDGDWYCSKYDRLHDVSIVANYEISEKYSLSAAWVYYTGSAVTFPSGKYEYDGMVVPYYTERNGYRMPDYHRLDLNLHMKGMEHKHYETSWDVSVYNVYNRYNAYSIYFQESADNPGVTEAVKLSLFGIVPSISWNFKF